MSQEIVLFGKVFESQKGKDYYKNFTLNEGIKAVRQSLKYIEDNYDVIIIDEVFSLLQYLFSDTLNDFRSKCISKLLKLIYKAKLILYTLIFLFQIQI